MILVDTEMVRNTGLGGTEGSTSPIAIAHRFISQIHDLLDGDGVLGSNFSVP